jgi:hypothetical protein
MIEARLIVILLGLMLILGISSIITSCAPCPEGYACVPPLTVPF